MSTSTHVPVPEPPLAPFVWGEKWLKQFDWLELRKQDDGSERPFCKKCKMFLFQQCLSGGNVTTLLRHERTVRHNGHNGPASAAEVPAIQDFLECLDNRANRRSFRSSRKGREKEWKLSWCLAEAFKASIHRQLAHAASTTVSQDAQGQVLSVRFFSSLKGKDRSVSGLLALVNDWGAGAADLATAVGRATKRFFIRSWKAPRGWRKKPTLNQKVYQSFKQNVLFIGSDAAADESKAIRLLAGKGASTSKAFRLFPNIKARVRDNAHAAGRFTLKWNVSETLGKTYQKYIRGKNSITSLIWHSADNKRIFNKHVTQNELITNGQSLKK